MQCEYFMRVGTLKDNGMQLSEYKYEMCHNALLQDKEMTGRYDWTHVQSEHDVPAEHYSYLIVFLFIFVIFL